MDNIVKKTILTALQILQILGFAWTLLCGAFWILCTRQLPYYSQKFRVPIAAFFAAIGVALVAWVILWIVDRRTAAHGSSGVAVGVGRVVPNALAGLAVLVLFVQATVILLHILYGIPASPYGLFGNDARGMWAFPVFESLILIIAGVIYDRLPKATAPG